MTDFFISYTGADEAWAEWIGFALEEAGFSVVIQAWDFRPGGNFVLEMQRAAEAAERTIMVLSPDYLKARFTDPEWAAAFADDPQQLRFKLLPVMVRSCEPQGLLAPVISIKLLGLDEETARARLLAGVSRTRAKPSRAPAYPGTQSAAVPKSFPGSPANTGHFGDAPAEVAPLPRGSTPARPAVLPRINLGPTDLDKRRFIQEGIAVVLKLFEESLIQAEAENDRVQTDFHATSATEFRAEVFVDGRSTCNCRIWKGGLHSEDSIGYAEGRIMSDGACNEVISLADYGRSLAFSALMAGGHYGAKPDFDLSRMTAEQMASYLWSRFVAPLASRR